MPPGERDPDLKHISIDPQRSTVLPTVKQALAINPQLKGMASPWSAPGWIKTSDSLIKGSFKLEATMPSPATWAVTSARCGKRGRIANPDRLLQTAIGIFHIQR